MIKHLATIFFIATLAGCTSIQFSPASTSHTYTPIVSADNVKVFRSERPEGNYQEIGLLHFKGASGLDRAIRSMKEKAAVQGGNAIIDIKVIAGGVVGTLVLIEE